MCKLINIPLFFLLSKETQDTNRNVVRPFGCLSEEVRRWLNLPSSPVTLPSGRFLGGSEEPSLFWGEVVRGLARPAFLKTSIYIPFGFCTEHLQLRSLESCFHLDSHMIWWARALPDFKRFLPHYKSKRGFGGFTSTLSKVPCHLCPPTGESGFFFFNFLIF